VQRVASVVGCLLCTVLSSCAYLPIAGPTADQIVDQEDSRHQQQYNLVNVDQHVIQVLAAQPQPSFHQSFRDYGKPPVSKIGPGDAITVTIWQIENDSGQGAGKIASMAVPAEVVGADGTISVPYAGRLHVAGLTARQVQGLIERRLETALAGAQAIVTVNSVHEVVSVNGEAGTGARVALPLNGIRLLDVIAAAGGARSPVFDTYVQLSRRGTTAKIPMAQLVSDPSENIYAWPGDTLTLIARPRSFMAFGATGLSSGHDVLINIDRERFTLAKALAKAGGLLDERADPTGVFLFRYEPPTVVSALHAAELPSGPGGTSPVIFRLDLRDPKGFLLAEQFPIQDNDIVYVANAPLTVTQKLFTLFNTLSGPIISGVAVTK
jgi:polysaccharide biosynthesis/export protein